MAKYPSVPGSFDSHWESSICSEFSDYVTCTGKTIFVTNTDLPFSVTQSFDLTRLPLTLGFIQIVESIAPTGSLTTLSPSTNPTPTTMESASSPPPGSATIPATSLSDSTASQSTVSPPLPDTDSGSLTLSKMASSSSGPNSNLAIPTDLPSLFTPAPIVSHSTSPSDTTSLPSSSSTISLDPVTTPQQALSSSSHSKVGPIAGGIIGGLLFLALLTLLWLYREKLLRRWRGSHRVAPSAEFLNAASRNDISGGGAFFGGGAPGGAATASIGQTNMAIYSRSGSVAASRATSPYGAAQGHMRDTSTPMSIYRDDPLPIGAGLSLMMMAGDDDGPHDEPPPPFTPGNFNDPLVEKLNDAARQRSELYRAVSRSGTISSSPEPRPPPLPRLRPAAAYTGRGSLSDSSVPGYAESSSSHADHSTATHATSVSRQDLYHRSYVDPFHESDSEEDMRQASPMLNPNKVSRLSMQIDGDARTRKQSQAADVVWAV